MPKVYDKKGSMMKSFAYTKAGMVAARNYAKETKGRVEVEPKSEMAGKMKRKKAYM